MMVPSQVKSWAYQPGGCLQPISDGLFSIQSSMDDYKSLLRVCDYIYQITEWSKRVISFIY